MKWINSNDDYFLRDFSDKNKAEKNTGDNTGSDSNATVQPNVGQEDTSPSDSGNTTASTNEFSFPGSSAPTQSSGRRDEPAIQQEPPIKKRRRARRRLIWFFLIVAIVLSVAFYIRYYVPYTSDTKTTGYITLVERRGLFFKTYEGEMISESHLNDTSQIYSRDFYFSIPNDSLGRLIQSYQGTGQKVTLTTQKYYGTLPWRGSQRIVVTGVSAK
ncbi:hypothetical protein [uncultured Duncaniella sp.]|uniref:hypothetical protein n=1 Tax=uncultured Duncaniella sp. TaxID=2768039 RepID=UPI00266F7F21|nr:hypothetical protein [uncultured Duncaniella sp.]